MSYFCNDGITMLVVGCLALMVAYPIIAKLRQNCASQKNETGRLVFLLIFILSVILISGVIKNMILNCSAIS